MTRTSKSGFVAILSLAAVPWAVPTNPNGFFVMLWGVVEPNRFDATIFIIRFIKSNTGLGGVGLDYFLLLSPLFFYCGAVVSATSGTIIGREDTRVTVGLLIVLGILPIIQSIILSVEIWLPTGTVVVGLIIWQFYRPVVPYLGGTSRADSEPSSIQSTGTNNSEDDSKTTTSDSPTDEETTTNGTDSKFSEEIQSDAEAARKAAESAKANGDSKKAIEEYQGAINLYQAAVEQLPAGEAELREELTEAIESTCADLEAVKTRHEQQNEISKAIQPAERSLQEAIVAYIEDDQTVARIRFRQARDTFEDTHETIIGSEDDLLTEPVAVAVQPDREPPTTTLSELSVIPEAATTALADVGTETVDDLDSSDESPWTPTAVEEMVNDETIEEDTATALTLLSWWHGDENYTFETAEAVARRRQQADYGFNQSS